MSKTVSLSLLLLLILLPLIGCQKPPVIKQFYADNTTIIAGDNVTMNWLVTDADKIVLLDDNGDAISILLDSYTVNPGKTTNYTLIASNSAGTDKKTVVINIDWKKTGDFYLKQENYDEALKSYIAAIESEPKDSEAYCQRGLVYLIKKQYDLSIADLTKAIELDPKSAEAYYNRGTTHLRIGESSDNSTNAYIHLTSAIYDFSKSKELNPLDPNNYFSRAWAYLLVGNCDMALADCAKLIDLTNHSAGAYRNRGMTYYLCGKLNSNKQDARKQYDLAIADFSKVIELDPKDAQAYIDRGSVYWNSIFEVDMAIADFTKAIELEPQNAEPYYNRGMVYYSINRGTTHNRLVMLYAAIADLDRFISISSDKALVKNAKSIKESAIIDKNRLMGNQ